MAAARRNGNDKTALVLAISAAAAVALGGLAFYMRREAQAVLRKLDRSKDEFARMVSMRNEIETLKRKSPRTPGGKENPDDILQFLGAKARQKAVPPGAMTVTRNPDASSGDWKETSYTVLLSQGKDKPLPRETVVGFLTGVEDERPSVRSKNLSLAFADQDLASVTLTFSYFQRK